jgi:hypothetical protein
MKAGAPDVSLLYGEAILLLVFPGRGASVPGFIQFVKNDERKISNVSGRAQPCAEFIDRRGAVVAATAKKCTRA